MTHICVSKLTIIGSDNGLSPGRRQAIIWTNDGILLIRTLGTNFNEILSEIRSFSFKKMHLRMSSAKWRLFCLGLNELMIVVAETIWQGNGRASMGPLSLTAIPVIRTQKRQYIRHFFLRCNYVSIFIYIITLTSAWVSKCIYMKLNDIIKYPFANSECKWKKPHRGRGRNSVLTLIHLAADCTGGCPWKIKC